MSARTGRVRPLPPARHPAFSGRWDEGDVVTDRRFRQCGEAGRQTQAVLGGDLHAGSTQPTQELADDPGVSAYSSHPERPPIARTAAEGFISTSRPSLSLMPLLCYMSPSIGRTDPSTRSMVIDQSTQRRRDPGLSSSLIRMLVPKECLG